MPTNHDSPKWSVTGEHSSRDHHLPPSASLSPRRYRRLLWRIVASTATVSLLPLLIMTAVNYHQFQTAIRHDAEHNVHRLTSHSERAVRFFLHERESALRLVVNSMDFSKACDNAELAQTLRNMRRSLFLGAPVDLGLVDSSGVQRCYAGPYALEGKNYKNQDWFHHVQHRGIYISDVFLGFRKSPHFVIAIRHESHDGKDFILRATIDSELLTEQLLRVGLRPFSDLFVINRKGVLQTDSRRYGEVLNKIPLPVPDYSSETHVATRKDRNGQRLFVGYAHVKGSPFILLSIEQESEVMGNWFRSRAMLIGFLLVSVGLILMVIVFASRQLVRQIHSADLARAQVFHKMEYTNKLASIGRLAAGVAHEINNPLAIISEKAGLLKDRFALSEEPPPKAKALPALDSILQSVERCSKVTHRLLGFAKHMDVQLETIDVEALLREVLGFLEREASLRGVIITVSAAEGLPAIHSDRGQLQQVFLNIINNALAAIEHSGAIDIDIGHGGKGYVSIKISDDGVGIPEENLKRIFEPFFTTKPGVGTGLGLSVTYGILQKLGGDISVNSQVGRGTTFIVTLPPQSLA